MTQLHFNSLLTIICFLNKNTSNLKWKTHFLLPEIRYHLKKKMEMEYKLFNVKKMTTTVIVSSVEILFTRFVFPQLQFSSGVHKLE